jgi:formylglycine-generating enzyme required for sulfatase activity
MAVLGCYQPDFNEKPCRDHDGCPPEWACVQGFCRAGSRDGEDPSRPALPQVSIQGGSFLMGTNLLGGINDYERPAHMRQVASFSLDEREVTVRAYRACVEARACGEPAKTPGCNYGKAGRDDHPINCVDWEQAQAFCRWLGRRLPTEDEWEFAARGAVGHSYPWGELSPNVGSYLCWKRGAADGTCPVGSFPRGQNGLHDMGGNVWEWTASRRCRYPERTTCDEPLAYVVRGAGWNDTDPKIVYAWVRLSNEPLTQDTNRGFRCAR